MMEIWKRIGTLLILVYPRVVYILGGFGPMVYKQEDIADALVVKHGLMRKTIIPLNPQRKIDKLEIWQLVSSITIWYI